MLSIPFLLVAYVAFVSAEATQRCRLAHSKDSDVAFAPSSIANHARQFVQGRNRHRLESYMKWDPLVRRSTDAHHRKSVELICPAWGTSTVKRKTEKACDIQD